MIDLEKEREAFMIMAKDQKANIENFSQAEDHFKTWCLRAELAQAEINDLKQKLARYENPDYVSVPRRPTNAMIGSGQSSDDKFLYHYQVSSVWDAMIEEWEKDRDLQDS